MADLLIVAGRASGTAGREGLALFTLSADAAGVTRSLLPSMDLTRKLARIDFNGVQAQRLGAGPVPGLVLLHGNGRRSIGRTAGPAQSVAERVGIV